MISENDPENKWRFQNNQDLIQRKKKASETWKVCNLYEAKQKSVPFYKVLQQVRKEVPILSG